MFYLMSIYVMKQSHNKCFNKSLPVVFLHSAQQTVLSSTRLEPQPTRWVFYSLPVQICGQISVFQSYESSTFVINHPRLGCQIQPSVFSLLQRRERRKKITLPEMLPFPKINPGISSPDLFMQLLCFICLFTLHQKASKNHHSPLFSNLPSAQNAWLQSSYNNAYRLTADHRQTHDPNGCRPFYSAPLSELKK